MTGIKTEALLQNLSEDVLALSEGLTPEETLALAIVLQALRDWRQAMVLLRFQPDHREAEALRRETEAFLRSRWFAQLMDLEGGILLEELGAAFGPGPAPKHAPRLRLAAQARADARRRQRARRRA